MLATIFAVLGGAATLVSAADFQVTVGISQNTGQVGAGFDPNRILPAAGDTVIFSFGIPSYIQSPETGSYDVTQGSADSPCQPLDGGFSTGPVTTVPGDGAGPTFTLTINDTTPLYFYSAVGTQCQEGMVLGVNTPAQGDGSIDGYASAAAALGGGSSASDSSASTSSTASSAESASGTSSASRSTSAITSTRPSSVTSAGSSTTSAARSASASASASSKASGAVSLVSLSRSAVAFVAVLGVVLALIS